MSYNNSSLKEISFPKDNNQNIDNKRYFYEVSRNISFNILSNYNNINNGENILNEEILNFNKNNKDILDSFLTKLYNNDSILIINEKNINDIFSIFKQIIFSESNVFITSIVMNINNFEVKHFNRIKEKNKLNEIKNYDFKKNENLDIQNNKIEYEIKDYNNINNIRYDDKEIDKFKNKNAQFEMAQKLNNYDKTNRNNIFSTSIRKCSSFNEKLINNKKKLINNISEKGIMDDINYYQYNKKNLSYDFKHYKNLFDLKKTQLQNNGKNINSNNKNGQKNLVKSENKDKDKTNNTSLKNNEDNKRKYFKTFYSLNILSNIKNDEGGSKEINNDKLEIKVNILKNTKNNNSNTKETLLSSSSQREKLIIQKIRELDLETLKFKEERNKIINLKNEYEKLQQQLINNIEEFELKKEEFEKYKQSEMDKIKMKKINEKKNNNTNINIKNNKLLLNTKNDKDIIKLLKGQIKDLENIIKLKDDELKIYSKNKNNTSILKYNNGNSKKAYNNFLSKKNFLNIKQNMDQAFSEKNIKDKKKLNTLSKNKYNKENKDNNINKDNLCNNIINIINTNKNNYTINTNSSKNYFENINKKISKMNIENFMNISYTHKPIQKNNIIKENNNNNKYINDKSKINISFQQNNKNKKILDKKNIYGTEIKELNKKYLFRKDKILNRKEIPKVKLNFMPKFNEIIESADDICDNNFSNENDLNSSNNILSKEKYENKKTFSKRKIKPIKELNKNFFSNGFEPKTNYNPRTSKNKISIINIMKNNFNKNNKLKTNNISIQKKNKSKIIDNNKSNSVTKNEKRIKKKNNNLDKNEEKNKINDNLINLINVDINSERKTHRDINIINKENDELIIPDKYKNTENNKLIKTIHPEGKTINIYNNKKEIFFKSGVKKEIFIDGYQLVHFPNGDIKQNFGDGKIVYYFNDSKTIQTTYKDGLNVFKFNNNQIEKHYPDGSKFIIFPDGTKRRISKNGNEETIYPDGKIQKSYVNSDNKYNNKNEEDILDNFEGMETNNENKNVFMSYLDIEQNEIDDD